MTLGTQDLTVQLGASRTATISITEPAGVQADNLPLTTWGSSFILANRLHTLTSIPPPPPCALSKGDDGANDQPFIVDTSPAQNTIVSTNAPNATQRSRPRHIIPILELGAGTGLVGLTAATLWGTCVVLTDVEGIVPGLTANIAVNAERLAGAAREANVARGSAGSGGEVGDEGSRVGAGGRARVYGGTLDWTAPTTARILVPGRRRREERREGVAMAGEGRMEDGRDGGFGQGGDDDDGDSGEDVSVVELRAGECRARIIMAADTVYSEDHPPLLVQTIEAWLMRGIDARFVLVYPLRIAYLDHIRDIWERLENIGLECVEEGRDEEDKDENWDEPAPYEWCVWKWRTAI